MSLDLKEILSGVVEEDHKRMEMELEQGLERFKSLLFEIEKAKKWDLAIWVEGEKNDVGLRKYEKDLNLLERGNLIKGEMKFTEHNTFREYQLTVKGLELIKKLSDETK